MGSHLVPQNAATHLCKASLVNAALLQKTPPMHVQASGQALATRDWPGLQGPSISALRRTASASQRCQAGPRGLAQVFGHPAVPQQPGGCLKRQQIWGPAPALGYPGRWRPCMLATPSHSFPMIGCEQHNNLAKITSFFPLVTLRVISGRRTTGTSLRMTWAHACVGA